MNSVTFSVYFFCYAKENRYIKLKTDSRSDLNM